MKKYVTNPITTCSLVLGLSTLHIRTQIKQKDYHLNHLSLRALCRMIHGTCGTMGIVVEGIRNKPLV